MESALIEEIYKFGVIPVLQIEDADRAVPVAELLSTGGLAIAEITFRTEAALDSIQNIARELPHILLERERPYVLSLTDANPIFEIRHQLFWLRPIDLINSSGSTPPGGQGKACQSYLVPSNDNP